MRVTVKDWIKVYWKTIRLRIINLQLKAKIKLSNRMVRKGENIILSNLRIEECFMMQYIEMGYHRSAQVIKETMLEQIKDAEVVYEIGNLPRWYYKFIIFCHTNDLLMFSKENMERRKNHNQVK
jgi:hypothetical protein